MTPAGGEVFAHELAQGVVEHDRTLASVSVMVDPPFLQRCLQIAGAEHAHDRHDLPHISTNMPR